MLADLFEVRETRNKGKGLFAKCFIPKGTVVCHECEHCKVLSKKEFDKMSEDEQEVYLIHAYRRKDGSYVMPCDDAKFLNHSCNSNILDTGKEFDIVVRDIQADEEATYDYRVFYDDLHMPCTCGEANCCKVITCEHPVPEALQAFWRSKLKNIPIDLIDRKDKMNY